MKKRKCKRSKKKHMYINNLAQSVWNQTGCTAAAFIRRAPNLPLPPTLKFVIYQHNSSRYITFSFFFNNSTIKENSLLHRRLLNVRAGSGQAYSRRTHSAVQVQVFCWQFPVPPLHQRHLASKIPQSCFRFILAIVWVILQCDVDCILRTFAKHVIN